MAPSTAARPSHSHAMLSPVVGSSLGNVDASSPGDVVVVAGNTTPKSVGDVVVGATMVVVVDGARVVVDFTVLVVAATDVVEATVVVDPATVVVDPATVVVVGGRVVVVCTTVVVVVGARVVVVVGASVVVVVGSRVVVVVGSRVVVVVGSRVVVVVGAAVVVVTGGRTTELDIARSSLPAEQFEASEQVKSRRRMWYGEPAIDAADVPAPQSASLATWPDHARTAEVDDAVNHTVSDAELVPV